MILDSRLFITAGAVLITAILCAWQLSSFLSDAELTQKQKSLSQQLASARAQVEIQLENSANELTSLIQSELVANAPSPAFEQSAFVTMILLKRGEVGDWSIEWSQTKNQNFNNFTLAPQVATWGLDLLSGDDVRLVRIESPDRRVFFALAVQITVKSSAGDEVKVAAGILPSSYFSLLTDAVKGTDDEMILVDTHGNSFAYSDQQYVGAKLDAHPLVGEMLQNPNVGEIKSSVTLNGDKSLGTFDKLRNSNLYLLINSPLPSRHRIAIQAFSHVFVVTIAIALLAVAGIAFFNQQDQLDKQRLETRLKAFEMRAGNFADGASSSVSKERLEGMKSLALSVIQYLRTPMSLMLGQAQIAQAAKDAGQIRSALTRIENAARAGREFLEGLAKSNGLEKFDVKPFVVETVVQQALAKTRHKIESAGIRIEENFKSREEAEISVNELRGALENLVRLMAERLKNSPHDERRMKVDIEQLGSLLRLRFADNGLSPDPGYLKKFFEPFAVAELQMATLKALAESFHGTVRVEKNDPHGLRVEIDLPTVIRGVAKDDAKVVNLAGREPVDPAKAPTLPPPPDTSPEVLVKEEISATEELSVVIRKPKVRSDV